jgi:hypothetical protein
LPPLAISHYPVAYSTSSLTKETARNAISSGLPHRLIESRAPGGKANSPLASSCPMPRRQGNGPSCCACRIPAHPPGHPHHPQPSMPRQRVDPLRGRQASKVSDTAPWLHHHPWEYGLEQEEGPPQLHLTLPIPRGKRQGTKCMGWQQTAKGLPQTSGDREEGYALHDPMT